MKSTNYLIIGSGVAGLTFALKIATLFPEKKIIIATKSNPDESNTKYAQGGIAIVTDKTEDCFEKHILDTLISGDGLCDLKVVEMVIKDGQNQLNQLIQWGTNFDKNGQGNFDLGKEGGHSQNRIVHHKDQTGKEIERAILTKAQQQKNIEFLDHFLAVDLIVEDNRCIGINGFDKKTETIITIQADYTLLATGGIGHLYGHTTNPTIATGDGIAMAYRAGAKIKEMEFIQFHPTAFYNKTTDSKFLISEAVRGFGAYLRTKNGERFMLNHDPRGELASRDIVSQSIDIELKKSGDDCVYLDCTHLETSKFIEHFPMIFNYCKINDVDITKDWIPVIPVQHYVCGGISVDTNGTTSIENLFACGECSQTGLHGANRLASNSLLEALVYANNIYNYLSNQKDVVQNPIVVFDQKSSEKPAINSDIILKLKIQLQLLMRESAGIVRNDDDLNTAKKQIEHWQLEVHILHENYKINTDIIELSNLLVVAHLIVFQSLKRNENCGGFVKTLPIACSL